MNMDVFNKDKEEIVFMFGRVVQQSYMIYSMKNRSINIKFEK